MNILTIVNMKNLIKINYLTYFFILSAVVCGMFKECLILFSIILLHELGHVITVVYFKYKIDYIEIFPFGGITKIRKDINSSINKEIIISLAGIFMQLVLFVILSILWQINLIDNSIYLIFKKYNLSILVFNLLPIIPLDGSIFLRSLLEKVFSFNLASKLIIIISFIVLFLFFYLNYIYDLDNYIIGIFLLYKIIDYIKMYKYLKNKFLLERYLNKYNYKKLKRIYNINQMQKERIHYMKIRDKLIKEQTILKNYFNKLGN